MQQRLRISAKIAAGFLFAWFISIPATVNALGFGNINMKSALNEPLVAEIELLSATSDDIKALEVKLASREAFLRAGVERSVILTRIRFDVVKRSGKYFISLRTQESIREPFLNFLLEMNWKNGRMLREYTVLLDPPERKQQTQMAQAPETTPAETFVEPAPSPLAEMPAAPEPMSAPEPMAAPEPMPAPEPVASPFLDTPAPEAAPAADEPLFPQVALDSEPQVPAEGAGSMAAAEPAPVPAPEPLVEPLPGPELVSAPEPIEPAPEVITPPADTVAAAPEPAFQEEEDGLFPQMPIQAYSEAALEAGAPDVAAAPEPYEPVGELDYGITRKGDSAWKIAEKLKPSEQISVYQVMMALQQSNPAAFIDGNIHRLKEGQVLRIDDASLLTAMSKEQAAEQYQLQTGAWEEYLTSVGAQVPRQAIVAGEDTGATATSGGSGGELTLATPQGDDLAGTGGDATGASSEDTALLREQVRQAMAEATAERNKNAELNSRLEQLEQELRRLESLVTVKDSDLAALQARLDELNQQRSISEPASVAQPEPLPEPTPEPMPEPAPVVEEPPTEVATAEPEPAPIEPVEPIEPGPLSPVDEAVPPSPLEPAAPADPGMPTTAQQTDDGGIMATITGILGGIIASLFAGGLITIIVAVVAVLILLLVILMIIKKRKGVSFQESILNGGGSDADAAVMDATPSQDSSVMSGESSFLSDFAISGVSAIQAEDSEVDPLTEADVFMAYGRYEAAEERLQEAISQDPGRGELRVKLLELFNTTKNKQGFESAAEEFYATLGDGATADPLWQKVVAMGSEIAPGNPLFSGEGMPTMNNDVMASPEPAMNLGSDDVMDIGLDTGVFSNSELTGGDTGSTEKAADAYTGGDLDFNLGSGSDSSDTGSSDLDFSLDSDESSAEIAMPSEADLNFDLNSGNESTQTAMSSDAGGLDFSLDADSPTTGELGGGNDDLDFNLDLGGDEETATDIKLDMGSSDSSGGLDFDLNTEDEDSSGDTEPGMDMNLDAGDAIDLEMAAGGDEVGTKLDLARAYIDMGDPDGARSILDEVIDEGDDGQKQEAQQLMSQIG